jgi:hypothetical protein
MKKIILKTFISFALILMIPSCSAEKVECWMCLKKFEKGEGYTSNKWGQCEKSYAAKFCSLKCAGCRKFNGKDVGR